MTTQEQQRKNRLALADMLEHRVTNKQFDMAEFTNHCGTAGCALGMAVMSGEFGYGWHPMWGGMAVKDGVEAAWEEVADDVFGEGTFSSIFTGMVYSREGHRKSNRREIAKALRKF